MDTDHLFKHKNITPMKKDKLKHTHTHALSETLKRD